MPSFTPATGCTPHLGGVCVNRIGKGISYWYCDPQASISGLFVTADFTAAPEPASLTLLGIGMIGTGVMARRRRSSTLPQAAC